MWEIKEIEIAKNKLFLKIKNRKIKNIGIKIEWIIVLCWIIRISISGRIEKIRKIKKFFKF